MDRQKIRERTWYVKLLVAGIIGLVFLMIGAAIGIMLLFSLSSASEDELARRALDLPRLAELPQSASAIKADGTSNMFSMSYFLRFQAPAEEIEAFVKESPGLSGITPEVFGPQHMHLPFPQNCNMNLMHRYFRPDNRYPWFDPTIRETGRLYNIPNDADACGGTVIINDKTNTVFVEAHCS